MGLKVALESEEVRADQYRVRILTSDDSLVDVAESASPWLSALP